MVLDHVLAHPKDGNYKSFLLLGPLPSMGHVFLLLQDHIESMLACIYKMAKVMAKKPFDIFLL